MSKKKHEPEPPSNDAPALVPLPCSDDELREHFQAFAHSFISGNRRDRWLPEHLLKGRNSQQEMPKFHRHCDPRFCTWLESRHSFPDLLVQRLGGNRIGVYFGDDAECCKLTVEGAAEKAMREGDAIFSILPGELAIFFPHDGGGIWLCQRAPQTRKKDR